jgi:glycosyltransferase involved in cell wall biosynthesis
LYAPWAAKAVAKVAIAEQVSVIHAASNHVNALPALLAARNFGIPFQYEMRGLWELTRVSRQPGFENSQAFRQGLELEALVARSADRLFVISEQLGRYVQAQWGVAPERIGLLPNCVDAEKFKPLDAALVEPDTLGFAGSLIGYEGLDTLLEALALLAAQGRVVRLRIAGDGEARKALESLAQRLGLGRQVAFLGRVAPEAAQAMIARSALVCLPRKPFEVCHIVPPIKLVEALAMGKPVIVPDLPVFRDELGLDPPGWFFQSGDAASLAQVIDQVLSEPQRLSAMGQKARDYVLAQRTWAPFAQRLLEA